MLSECAAAFTLSAMVLHVQVMLKECQAGVGKVGLIATSRSILFAKSHAVVAARNRYATDAVRYVFV